MSTEERERIDDEMNRRGVKNVMNNFNVRLSPGGDLDDAEVLDRIRRTHPMNIRTIVAYNDAMDTPWEDLYKSWGYIPEENANYPHSDMFFKETPRVFFANIDGMLSEMDYDYEQLRDLYDRDELLELYTLLKPAFLALIEMGYSEADLAQ